MQDQNFLKEISLFYGILPNVHLKTGISLNLQSEEEKKK